jgi:Transposase DDE domain
MHVAKVTSRQNGREYTSWLVRQSYRDGDKVKHRTLANLSALPDAAVDAVRAVLQGAELAPASSAFRIERSLPHGHVQSVLDMVRKLGLEQLIDSASSRQRDLVMGVIVQRLLKPSSKLGMTRLWGESTLASTLGIEDATDDEVYAAMDWVGERQERIEKKLAGRHLAEGGMALYDLSSSYMEGTHCPLAKRGYSRDGKRGTLQIEYGVITNTEGCPVAVEVVEGNTGDPKTVPIQLEKLQQRFGLRDVVLVGDRGMLTSTQIDTLREKGLGWISSLRSPAIRKLLESGSLQLSLFDERNLVEITDPAFPGERLVVCRNPFLAEERTRKREDLLRATEAKLASITKRVTAGKLQGAAEIGVVVGKVKNAHKVGKHFEIVITDSTMTVQRKQAEIDAEASMDGFYVVRTSVSADKLESSSVVRAYKQLEQVERVFRSFKAVDFQVRPVRHWAEQRVRAHVLLCLLTYYVQWHLERAWASLLFRDEDRPEQSDAVAPAQRSAAALRKARTQRTVDGTTVHSFSTLMCHLATLTRNRVRAHGADATFELLANPTPLQEHALSLIASAPRL